MQSKVQAENKRIKGAKEKENLSSCTSFDLRLGILKPRRFALEPRMIVSTAQILLCNLRYQGQFQFL